MRAQLIWNPERDACIITWSLRPTTLPLDPINNALALFYNNNMRPFLYEAWDGQVPAGLLLADSLELEDNEIFAIFNQIRQANQAAPQTGDWAPQEFML